jgi:hypothetical protein
VPLPISKGIRMKSPPEEQQRAPGRDGGAWGALVNARGTPEASGERPGESECYFGSRGALAVAWEQQQFQGNNLSLMHI